MSVKEIFKKTMPFQMAKLALGGITIGISLVLLLIIMGISLLFKSPTLGIFIWLAVSASVYYFVMHYMGYIVKAGYVAVIAQAVTTGQIPENQVRYGKQLVAERFATANVYFVVDNLVSKATKQLQNMIEKTGNLLDFIPGAGVVTIFAKMFVNISLGYIDECCLGYTFYKKEQGACQSAADGVVIYVQNWKKLLKSAGLTALKVVLFLVVSTLILFGTIGLLFAAFGWNRFLAFLLACMISGVLKSTFVDSYILIMMMSVYMEVAPSTELSFDLYGKLCGMSRSFKDLFEKGQAEVSQSA